MQSQVAIKEEQPQVPQNSKIFLVTGIGPCQQVAIFSATSEESRIFFNYCRKSRHTKIQCWRASKSCLICRKQHVMMDCSKYDLHFKGRRQ